MLSSLSQTKYKKKLSLQSVLIVPFLLQIFAAVGLTGYFSLRNGQRAVEDLATQLQGEVSDRVNQHLDAFLTTPPQINQINLGATEIGLLDLYDFETTGQYFWQQMQVYDVSYIAFGDTEGNFIGVEKIDEDSFHIVDNYLNADAPNALAELSETGVVLPNRYKASRTGERTARLEVTEDDAFDHRREAWYSDAVDAGKPVWSSIYQWDDQPEVMAISSSYPVFDDDNQLVGIMGIDHVVSQINGFLTALETSPAARIVVLERDGNIVSSSSTEPSFIVTEAGGERLQVIDSDDPLIRATGEYLEEKFGSFDEIDDLQQLSFELDGKKQFLQVAPWQDELGLDWLVLVAVPESDFMAQINQNTRTTIGLCLAALGIAAVLAILTARWVANPIIKLKTASQAIAQGEFGKQVEVEGTQEVATLGASFNQMSRQLQESFRKLEQSKVELENRVEERTADLKDKNEQLAQTLEQLKSTQAQMVAQEKLASLGSLTAGIAHEIKNPLNFVNNFSEIAVDLVDDLAEDLETQKETVNAETFTNITEIIEQLKTLVSKIDHHGKRADSIVANMLQHSRNDSSAREAVDINALVEDAINLAYHGMRARQSEFNMEFDTDYDESIAPVTVSPQDISRVFLNIASNACYAIYQRQHSEGSGFKPLLKVHTRAEDGNVVICIRDNGTGMSPEVKAKVFDQFFTTKPTGEGTGLGLSLSYNIVVEQHQGTMTVESEPGGYTDFIVTLPV